MSSYLTTSDVATRLGVSLDTVRRWLRSGELKGTPFGRAGYRIDDVDFQAFLALRRRQSQDPSPSFPEYSSRSNAALDERMERKSRAEYFALLENDPEHRYEYLDGYIYMMTGGSPDHSIIGNNIGRILGNLLQGRRCIVYNSDLYVELSDNYRVCPDATVSCDPRDRGSQDAIRYPCLVVEVLFPTTEARDRGKKSLQYRSCPTI